MAEGGEEEEEEEGVVEEEEGDTEGMMTTAVPLLPTHTLPTHTHLWEEE